jgi:hypothetical protein
MTMPVLWKATGKRTYAWAILVGSEDPKSFYRAFRSWEAKRPPNSVPANQPRKFKTGLTPRRIRRDILPDFGAFDIFKNLDIPCALENYKPAFGDTAC